VPGSDGAGLDLVVFTHDLGYGGGQLWLSELLAKAGAGRSFPCTVISPGDGPLREELERCGVSVRITQPYPTDSLGSYEGRAEELCQVVGAGGHNAALVNTLLVAMGADVTRRLGIPTVWAIHESITPSAYWAHALGDAVIPAGIRRRFEDTLRETSALVFEAEATRRLFADAAEVDRTVVIPYGIDTGSVAAFSATNSRNQARRSVGIHPGRKVALVMGTTEPRKAQTRLAQGFDEVAADHPDWDLVFVGDNGSAYAEALRRFIAETGLDERARVIPVVADTYPWYRAADLMVSASEIESLPRSALEAMCFGVPVLATDIFGLPELIDDSVNGFLFAPSDLVALTAAFRRVFSLPSDHLAAIGEEARRLIIGEYDSEGYATDVISLLEHLVHGADGSPAEFLAGRRRHPQQQNLPIGGVRA
jgi:D-inositol-3-phosphate glycosyltransferase